jgi:beta-galactosidase
MRSQRRIVPGLSVLFLFAAGAISVLSRAEPHRLELTGAKPVASASGFKMGTSRTLDGKTLTVDGWSLLRDGRRWLPVMGEIHYARYPGREWRDELLKMKAGGIDIVATYVFWIHHEEIEGQFDWSGQRNLRRFVQTCAEIGLPVVVRIGPWCHGEVRNGGLPDWLLRKGVKVRSDDPGYLEKARVLYGEIAAQLRGLLWKDGGPVIGIQVENEYGGPADHLLTLKRLAREAGLDVPLYTRTGWPSLRTPIPFGEILPLFGAYAEGFWDRELTPMPGKYWQAFTFELMRADAAIATDQLGERAAQDGGDTTRYPYLTCELGGGMMGSYHRRIRLAPEDIVAVALTKIGSGSNLPGYYMYHGGTNPEGRLSTLQELQATPITNWNDLPVKTYDFQAPLGEFGQVRAHYHLLRRLHLFLRDFGEALTTMPAAVPATRPGNQEDAGTLRWSARSDGRSGFVFVNNYQRLLPMPAKAGVQFELKTDDGIVRLPENPCTVPADASFFWPFNLNLDGARLIYATAQPVCRVEDGGTAYVVFAQTKGVPTEFVFAAAGLTMESATGEVASGGDRIRIQDVRPGTGAAIRLQTPTGRRLGLIVLDEAASLACWKDRWHGQERIFLARAAMLIDGENVRLQSEDPSELSVAMLPAPGVLKVDGVRVAGQADGVFRRFNAPRSPTKPVPVVLEPMQAAGPGRAISMGSQKVAEAPGDADFAAAAVWRVKFPEGLDPARDLLLRLHYTGDVARLYLGDRLLTDNFYNGNVFDLGLRRFAPEVRQQELLLKILPLRKDAPILLPADAGPKFGDAESAVVLARAEVIETHSVAMSPE